jgi:hypothetical protein
MGEPEGLVLGETLLVLFTAWGEMAEAFQSKLLLGVGIYLHEHRESNPTAVSEALLRTQGAPINLIGAAKQIAGMQRTSLPVAIAKVVDASMRRRPGGKAAKAEKAG